MTFSEPREPVVLILSDQVLEATDIAEFASARSLGQIVVERDYEQALAFIDVSSARITHAFIGLPSSVDLTKLVDKLLAHETRIILINGTHDVVNPDASIVRVRRPFVDTDLEKAIAMVKTVERPG